ncbi:MAG: YaiO family outer membrane beta-barrel protein [Bryobacterales bacterium]|nr:YaiO family outer membrane beta-barrel protein [Bryobacterales bacterium]
MRARELAVNGDRKAALALLERELANSPRDIDARLIYGIILSWEGRYDDARQALDSVLERAPGYTDAREALIRTELWSGNAGRAERLAAEGQQLRPGHTFYLLSRIRALIRQKRDKEALGYVRNFLDLEPGNAEARAMREEIETNLRTWRVGADRTSVWFSGGQAAWQETGITFRGMTPFGRAGVRFSSATRFRYRSQLVEVDAYPRIRPGTYLYVAGAYSPDRILFPAYRIAGEVFQTLGQGFEGSVGFRRFRFAAPFTMYTGSLGRYFGPYLVSARTFLSRDEAGISPSMQYTVRRYFGDYEKFVAFRYGWGASPFEVRSANEYEVLRSHSFAAEISGRINSRLGYRGTVGFGTQDRTGRSAIRQYVLDGSFDYRF